MGLWLEIVTLLIPGFNDSPDELRRLTEFLAGISPDIPWHVTAFHGDYKMQNDVARDTTVEDLLQAVEIGRSSGLRYIYAGNLPGMVDRWEDTHCPQCDALLIKRYGYLIEDYRLTPDGRCPDAAPQFRVAGQRNSKARSPRILSCRVAACSCSPSRIRPRALSSASFASSRAFSSGTRNLARTKSCISKRPSRSCFHQTHRYINLTSSHHGPYENPKTMFSLSAILLFTSLAVSRFQTKTHSRRFFQFRQLPSLASLPTATPWSSPPNAPTGINKFSAKISGSIATRRAGFADPTDAIRTRHRSQVVARWPLDRLPLRTQIPHPGKSDDSDADSDSKNDVSQLYLISPNGGEAIPLTQGEEDVHTFSWSADSQAHLFTRLASPGPRPKKTTTSSTGKTSCNIAQPSAATRSSLSTWPRHCPVTSPSPKVDKEEANAEKESDLTPGAQPLRPCPLRVDDLVTSPDGSKLAFITNAINQRQEKYEDVEIYVVPGSQSSLAADQKVCSPPPLTHNQAVRRQSALGQ